MSARDGVLRQSFVRPSFRPASARCAEARQSGSRKTAPRARAASGGRAEPWLRPILALGVTGVLAGRRQLRTGRQATGTLSRLVPPPKKPAGVAGGGLRIHQPGEAAGETGAEGAEEQESHSSESSASNDVIEGLGMGINEFRDVFRYAFDRFDLDGNGQLTLEEFQCALMTLGLKLKPEDAKTLFHTLSNGSDHWVPTATQQTPQEKVYQAVQDAVMKQYKASGLNRMVLILANVTDTMAEGSASERFSSMVSTLQGYSDRIFEQFEGVINIVGTVIAGYSVMCSMAEGESLDVVSTAPLLLLIWRNLADTKQVIADALTTDLCQDHATVFAKVFKPAGFSVSASQRLCAEAEASWVNVPAGAKINPERLDERLMLIGKGQVKVMYKSSAPGLEETSATFGAGIFLGHGALLGTDQLGISLTGGRHFMVAAEDTLILQLDRKKLQRYLKVDEGACQAFYYALARSQLDMMSLIKRQARLVANELPLFFRDLALAAASGFNADRATFWIYNAEQSALWTLFVNEDGSSTFVSIDHGSGLAGHCLQQGEVINILDCYQDERFNQDVDMTTGYHTQSMLCVPIIEKGCSNNNHGQVIGVLQLINKKTEPSVFTSEDARNAVRGVQLTSLIVRQLIDRYHSDSGIQGIDMSAG